MKIVEQRTIYYSDELNDEFSGAQITPKVINKDYVYIHKNHLWDMASAVIQNVLSMPIKYIYAKCKLGVKYIGKEKLKPYKKDGYFVYVNHTHPFADTFIPSLPIFPKRNFFIVNPENVSIKYIGKLVEYLGALPIPCDIGGMKNFIRAVETRIEQKHSITIYPEAHIWPFYTDIRPFKDVSFKYPVTLDKPSFCMTNTYKRCGRKGDRLRVITYIDGPFFPDRTKSAKEMQRLLRDEIYSCMKERSRNSDVEYIRYVKRNEDIQEKY